MSCSGGQRELFPDGVLAGLHEEDGEDFTEKILLFYFLLYHLCQLCENLTVSFVLCLRVQD